MGSGMGLRGPPRRPTGPACATSAEATAAALSWGNVSSSAPTRPASVHDRKFSALLGELMLPRSWLQLPAAHQPSVCDVSAYSTRLQEQPRMGVPRLVVSAATPATGSSTP